VGLPVAAKSPAGHHYPDVLGLRSKLSSLETDAITEAAEAYAGA
jgi:hypothetical protein